MNRVYRLVWNAAQNGWVVASEFAAACGKGKKSLRRASALVTGAAVTALALSAPANAYMIDPAQILNGGTITTQDGGQASNTAIGSKAVATGSEATAVGSTAVASGVGSVAVGRGSSAQGASAVAIGSMSTAMADDSIAVRGTAHGRGSVALGVAANANHAGDIALGANSETGVTSTTTSVTLGGKTYQFAGAGAGVVSQLSVGLQNNERLITNVGAGALTETSTDAVNGSQLNATNQALNSLTATVSDDALLWDSALGAFNASHGSSATTKIVNVSAGTLSANSTDAVNGSQLYETNKNLAAIDTRLTTVENSITNNGNNNGSGNNVAASPYVDVKSTAANASATGAESVAIGGAASATAENAVAIGGNSVADRANTVSVGSGGNERQITNVAEGVEATDAVNVAQLREATENLGDSMFQVNNTKKLAAPSATGANAIAGGAGAKATAENSMALGNGATATAKNSVALGTGSVADRENSVSVGAAGSERQITNVAAGTRDTDAANVGQVKRAYQYTDEKYNDLQNRLGDQEDKLSAGIASAMAMANLPQPYSAGASMVGLAGGSYNGGSAMALGVSTISDNGKWVSKFSGSTNTEGDFGAALGVGYQF